MRTASVGTSVCKKPKRPYHILTIEIDANSCVHTNIDLPPCLTPPGPAGAWPAKDIVDHVEWEIRQLQAHPSTGLLSIECGGPPAMFVNENGEAEVWRADEMEAPPLLVYAQLRAPVGSPYHNSEGFRVRLLIDDRYPLSAPEANFMQTLHHFFVDNDNGLPSIFYELLTDLVADFVEPGEPPQHTLRATLQLLVHVLQSPLHPCEGCQEQFDGFAKMHAERYQIITDYIPFRAHAELFDSGAGWSADWLHPHLRTALHGDGLRHDDACARDERLRSLLTECAEGIFSFPCLNDEACDKLTDEVDAYAASGLPQARPNSMNKYGLVLNEIGMERLFDSLQERVLQPLARLVFPLEGGSLDRHHSFVVQYQEGKDLGLDMHTDNSDVTFNICIGRDFSGAGLTFCGHMGEAHHRHFTYRHEHVKGHCVMHLGRRRHGADDITSGERLNLIIWNTNLAHRNSSAYLELQRQHRYEREASAPDPVCLSYTHDRDYLKYKEKPAQHAKVTHGVPFSCGGALSSSPCPPHSPTFLTAVLYAPS